MTFTSSFSKTVAPGLRVGWFVVPEALRAALRRPRRLDVHLAAAPAAGDRARAVRARRLRAQPRADPRHPARPARRDARPRSTSELRGRATWSRPEGGLLPLGRLRRGRRRGRAARPRDRGGRHVRPRAPTSSRRRRGRELRPARVLATSRPSGSPRASRSSPACSSSARCRRLSARATQRRRRRQAGRARRRAPC